MKRISQREFDFTYIKHQLNSLIDEYDISTQLRNFLALFRIVHEESFPPKIRELLSSTQNAIGKKIKDELIGNFERWLKSHASGKDLFQWDDYDNLDKEASWAYSLVENGEVEGGGGFEFDIKALAARKLISLAKEFYKILDKEDIESFRYIADELAFGSTELWKSLDERFREFIAKKFTPLAFKKWKNLWGEALIKPTKDVSEALERLKNSSIKDLPSAISLALNVMHVHGRMLEHTNLNSQDLDYLDNLPQGEIERVKKFIFGDEYSLSL